MATLTSLSNVRTRPQDRPIQVAFSPADTDICVLPNDLRNIVVWLTPAGTLPTLTIRLPLDTNTEVLQTITIRSSQTITALTIAANASDGATTIYAPSTVGPGAPIILQKQASKVWG